MEKKRKIIVAGGGASGLVAAIEAAERGLDVLILEANEKAGKKLYATGNGKCNLTNRNMTTDCYRGGDKKRIASVLERFGCRETMAYFSGLGLRLKDKNGYIYPSSGQASSVVMVLLTECERLGIKIECNTAVTAVAKNKNSFEVTTTGKSYSADGVILACGSLAGIAKKKLLPVNGYSLAEGLGHKIVPVVSALTGICCENAVFYKKTAGVRCDGSIRVYEKCTDGSEIVYGSDSGELQLTGYGISGIPAFQVSGYASYGVREKKNVCCSIDFFPALSEDEVFCIICAEAERNKEKTVLQYVSGLLNDKLAGAIAEYAGTNRNKRGYELSREEIRRIAAGIKGYKDKILCTKAFEDAQVLAGGVSLEDINEDMESEHIKNLYITGELLDADGICGGYNLQWAWATGYIAGNAILREQKGTIVK